MISAKLLYLLTGILLISLVQGNKKYRLNILYMLPFSGRVGQNTDIAKFAGIVALNHGNNRSDLLPDYEVGIQWADEELGNGATKAIMKYYRLFEDTNPAQYQTPLIIGPAYSAGCKSIGKMVRYIDAIAVSPSCAAPYLADRSQIPNLYLLGETAQVIALGMLHFMKEVGKWKRFAIVTYAGNPTDYGTANFLQKVATDPKLGFDVVSYDLLMEPDIGTVAALKKNDVRVFVIYMSVNIPQFQFLCMAYKMGITGPRYVFIFYRNSYADPDVVPNFAALGCTKEMVKEQYKNAYWFGTLAAFPDPTVRSTWGYSQDEFLQELKDMSNDKTYTDWLSNSAYHDVIITAMYTLDKAESLLRKQNLSLRDYRTNSYQLTEAVRQGLLSTKVSGVRIGNLSFSQQGIIEGCGLLVDRYEDGVMKVVAKMRQSVPDYAYDSYRLNTMGAIKWSSGSYTPPNDSPMNITVIKTVSQGVLVAVILLAAILSVACLIGAAVMLIKGKNGTWKFPISKLIGSCGSLVLNAASIAFVVDGVPQSARIALLTMGLAIIHGVLIARVFVWQCRSVREMVDKYIGAATGINIQTVRASSSAIKGTADKARVSLAARPSITPDPSMSPRPSSTANNKIIPQTMAASDWALLDTYSAPFAAGFATLHGILLAIWLGRDDFRCSLEMDGTPLNDEEADTVTYTQFMLCTSPEIQGWILALAFFNVLALLYAAFRCRAAAAMVKHAHEAKLQLEFQLMLLGCINALTLLLGTILILVILRNAVAQYTAVAFCALVINFLTLVTWYFSEIKPAFEH